MPLCSRDNCKKPHIKEEILSLCFIDNNALVCPTCATDELMLEIAQGKYTQCNNPIERNKLNKLIAELKTRKEGENKVC